METQRTWRKSSYSGAQSNCVELSSGNDAIRDSKNGEVLRLTPATITMLVAWCRTGERTG